MKKTETKLKERPPVVVVMGHIDHGKSSLLDYIRKSNVVAGEAGGITQHISAYEAERSGKKITFLDTPGHESFDHLRHLGAGLADLAILVVSGEEGVKDQTLQSKQAIEAAGIPFVIAITKTDRPNVNVEKIKQNLAEHSLLVEGYGGQIPWAAVSAKTGDGIDALLDLILLVAELAQLTTNPAESGVATVLEARLDKRAGTVASIIIKDGTFHLGDFVVAGADLFRLRQLTDFLGRATKELSASSPAAVLGWCDLPESGIAVRAFSDKKSAEQYLAAQPTQGRQAPPDKTIAELANGSMAIKIPIVIKTDTAGTLPAIVCEIKKVKIEGVNLVVIDQGVGVISENDVKLASGSSSHALVLGFGVNIDKSATQSAEKLGVTIQTFDIIYKLSEWLAERAEALRPRVQVKEPIGRAKILKVFSSSKNRHVIGGVVATGMMVEGRSGEVVRREADIGQAKIVELQQQKVRMKTVEKDKQFGALIESKITPAAGDHLELFEIVSK